MFERVKGRIDDDAIALYYGDAIERSKSSFPVMMKVNQAHVVMLAEQGLISRETARRLLETFARMLEAGVEAIRIDPGLEDLYTNVERAVLEAAGAEVGGQMHMGRSRNDLEPAIARIMARDALNDIALSIHALAELLAGKAREHAGSVLPGFTHWQPAQPTTLGHYLIAVVDHLLRDLERLDAAYRRTNRSPLGAAAFNGTSFAINRLRTAELLGFDGLAENTLDAAAGVDHWVEAASVLANHALTLARYASDVVRWSMPWLGYVELADGWSDSSSIMPQKKNPVMAETVRAQAAVATSLLAGYMEACRTTLEPCRDITVAEGKLWDLFDHVGRMTKITLGFSRGMTVHVERMQGQATIGFTAATELADTLVRESGLSFREAHRVVANIAREVMERGGDSTIVTAGRVKEAAAAVLGRSISLTEESVARALAPGRFVEARSHAGGPAPAEVRRMAEQRMAELAKHRQLIEERFAQCQRGDAMLAEAMKRVLQG